MNSATCIAESGGYDNSSCKLQCGNALYNATDVVL